MRYKLSFCLMMVIILFCFTIACERADPDQELVQDSLHSSNVNCVYEGQVPKKGYI